MPREATGEVRRASDGTLSCRVRVAGKRTTFQLPTCRTDVEAEERAATLGSMARAFQRAGLVESPDATRLLEMAAAATPALLPGVLQVASELAGGELVDATSRTVPTFAQVAKKWTSGELHRDFPDHVRGKDSELDAARLERLCAIDVGGIRLGDVPIDRLTLEHADAVLRDLPAVAKRPGTRRHYAQLVHRVLSLAVYPLKLIKASPLPRGWLPKPGKPPAYPYLHPADDALLLASKAVPLEWRVFWGFCDREGARVGEAAQMRLGVELDLDRGTVSLDENKTDDPRTWAVGDDVQRALSRWCELRKLSRGDLVFTDHAGDPITVGKLAEQLRTHVTAAGIDRPELTERGTNRGRLRAHDLRGTFVTLALATGRTETWVADRTGHRSSQMINRYRRGARSAKELGLGWLAPLDETIPELADCPTIAPKGAPNRSGTKHEPASKQLKAEVAEWQTRRIQNPFP